jgi:hypothetical protein
MNISPRPVAMGDIRRQQGLYFNESLPDELAREVDIGAVLEDCRYLREAVAGNRARVIESRNTG